jgi:ribose-phosphate pyrophosphokinase
MKKQLIVGAHDSILAQKAAHAFALGPEFIPYAITRFSDTESKITFHATQALADSQVFLFFQLHAQRGAAPSLNEQLFDLLLIIQQLKLFHVHKISLLLPYMPYARQEKDTLFGTLLQKAGVDDIIACDIHAMTLARVIPVALHHISLASLWTAVCKDFKDPVLVSPDHGGRDRVAAVAKKTGLPTAFIKKERIDGDAVALALVGDVTGKTVILIDDIVDTAQTALGASKLLIKHGAGRVIACFSHAVLSGNAYDLLLSSDFEHIFVSNSLLFDVAGFDKKFTVISMHDLLIESLMSYPEPLKKGIVNATLR